ncbi:MAG: hypothetical protein OXU37_00695 [Thaumarchaeota archaeon]|nr:hypothetical protein [Nitrososphaerota archaeon]MDD9812783.1 hypothetical protein [Nitrososphaerota archaeon]
MTIGLFHDGAIVDEDGVITLVTARVPITLEIRLGHWENDGMGVPAFRELSDPADLPGGLPAFSMGIKAWGGAGESHADPAPPTLADSGDGTAILTVGRWVPAVGEIRLAAGEAHRELRIDVIPRPPARYGDPDGPDRPPPRIAAQARQPLCADVTYEASGIDAQALGRGFFDKPASLLYGKTVSGVPPIDGTIHQDGFYRVPLDGPELAGGRSEWGCHTRASFGTQAPQLLRLCEIPGHDRIHYYTRHAFDSYENSSTRMISPYTGYRTTLSTSPAFTYAAAPGPYWEYDSGGGATLPYRPDEYVPPNVLYPIRSDGTASMILSKVIGTYSSVPELLPFDNLVVIRATGFHADDVVFDVSPGAGIGLPHDGALAYVNGTVVPVEIKQHSAGIPGTTAQVRASVSEIAWGNGVLVRGITDARAAADSVVRDLHEVTLVAEIPVDTGGGAGYERLDPSRYVEPWGCWPRTGGEPMRAGSRDPWPAEPRAGARLLPAGPEREHVAMGEPPDEHMEDTASPEPTFVDVRAPEGWGDGTVISARVASSSTWPPSPGVAEAPRVDVANRGDGTAILGIERRGPGEHAIEITATGPSGTATEVRTLRIVPPGGAGAAHWRMEMGGPPGELMEAAASPEPATLDIRAPEGWGAGTAISARVSASSPWPPLRGAAEAPGLHMADRGDGTAALAIGRDVPAEHVIEVTASGPRGTATEERALRIVQPPRVEAAVPNLEPELAVLVGGEPAGAIIDLLASGTPARIELRAADPEGDPVRFSVAAGDSTYGERAPSMVRLADRGDGTAALLVDRGEPGELALEISAADAHGEDWDVYFVRVAPAPGPALFMGGARLHPPLVELRASGGPVALEARAGADGGEASVRALRSERWDGGATGPPSVEGRGGGIALAWVDASAPGEHLVEASDASGSSLYVIRVLPAAKR